jgi:hypothetical protein
LTKPILCGLPYLVWKKERGKTHQDSFHKEDHFNNIKEMEVLEQSAVVLAGSIPIISVLFSRTHVFFLKKNFYVGVMEIRKIQVKVSIEICLQINIQGGQ